MKHFNIYLAGAMGCFGIDRFEEGNAWRVKTKNVLENICSIYKVHVSNPNDYFNFKEERYNSQLEIMKFDLHKVKTSDLVIVNFNDDDNNSLGTMAELATAYEKGIPIIGINIENKKLHPWQIDMCNRICNDFDETYIYVKDFYLN